MAKESYSSSLLYGEVIQSLEDMLKEAIFRISSRSGIVCANKALLTMFRYDSLEELKGIPHNALYADDEARSFLFEKIKAGGMIKGHRILYKRKDGGNFWGKLTCKKVLYDEEVYVEGVITEITEQVAWEEQLREKTYALEKTTLELDRFIYSASHDIRSPVASILGIISLMKIEFQESHVQEYIAMMEASTHRLDRFVRELSSFARNAKQVIEESNINFEDLTTNVLKELRGHPAHDRVTISAEISAENHFYSDPFRLHLILTNTIKNALDFSDDRKSNQIIFIHVNVLPEKAILEIFDNGMGISKSHIDRVFDMFYKASSLSKGSGLGLYIAREAIIKLGGIITLNSEFGIGTSLRIELPNSTKGKLINKRKSLRKLK